MPFLLDINWLRPAPAIPPRGSDLLSSDRLSSAKIGRLSDVGVEVGDSIPRGDGFVYTPVYVQRDATGAPTVMQIVLWSLQFSEQLDRTDGGMHTPHGWAHCAPPTSKSDWVCRAEPNLPPSR